MLETDYVHALMARASAELREYRFFRRNTGAIKLDDRMFRAGIPGQCDLYILGKGGTHYEVEVKRFTRLSAAQLSWKNWCILWGVPWMLLEVGKDEMPPVTIQRWMTELGKFLHPGQ